MKRVLPPHRYRLYGGDDIIIHTSDSWTALVSLWAESHATIKRTSGGNTTVEVDHKKPFPYIVDTLNKNRVSPALMRNVLRERRIFPWVW